MCEVRNYKELGWESVSDRRWYRRLVLFLILSMALSLIIYPRYYMRLENKDMTSETPTATSNQNDELMPLKIVFFHTASTSGTN